MEKSILFLIGLLSLPLTSLSAPVPKEIYSQFKGINVVDLSRDIDLTDSVLSIKMNFDEPIPEVL